MAKIGEARFDENGNTSYGQPGDQTTKEVCVSDFYINPNKPWQKVFRAKRKEIRNKLAQNMLDACANDAIGYAQYGDGSTKYRDRYGLYFALQTGKTMAGVTIPCNCDCSSLVAECCILSGISVSIYMSTSNECQLLRNTGEFDELTFDSSMNLVAGDIMWRQGHTGIIVEGSSRTWDTTPKWVGEATQNCDVYSSNSTSSPLLSTYPHLNKGNLVDVCDEDTNFYYVRIAAKYYGFVKRSDLQDVNKTFEKFTGQATTLLNVRTGPGSKYGYCTFNRNDGNGNRHTLNKGETVPVIGEENGWYQLEIIGENEAWAPWCSSKYIKNVGPYVKPITVGANITLIGNVLYTSKEGLTGKVTRVEGDRYFLSLSDGCVGYADRVDFELK